MGWVQPGTLIVLTFRGPVAHAAALMPERSTTRLIGAAYLAATGAAGRGTRFIDWTDLLWSGVRKSADPVPGHPDPGTPATFWAGWMDGLF